MTRLWLFNLDAEEELAALRARVPWTSRRASAGKRSRMESAAARLASPIVDGGWRAIGDGVLADTGDGHGVDRTASGDALARAGVAWCPTPSAIARLGARGAIVSEVVDTDTLARANARETFADLNPLPLGLVACDEAEVRAAVSRAPLRRSSRSSRAPAWLLRRSLVAAGQGRLVVEQWDDRVHAWCRSALALGPVHVAPFVDVVDEFALHGRVTPGGAIRLGRPVAQRTAGGAYRSAELARAGALSADELTGLVSAADEVGQRLTAMSYVGPFGIDAFRWTDAGGTARFHAPSEVNARFTMSFSIGAPELMPAR